MARSGSSSRFVSVNLSKSYGQPSPPAPGHGGSVSSPFASSPSANRTRVQSGHNGMVVLSRPGRSQPSASSTASRTSKLAVPRPVNLPSRRREHAGNDPNVTLVGVSGSAGWSKVQVSTSPTVDSVMAVQSLPAESAAVRSTAMVPESSWSSPVSKGGGAEQQESFYQAGASFYQAPTGKSASYSVPSSRSANAFNGVPAQPSEKIMVVRGEDFPTLQAAARPLVVPTLQRQKDMQQKQKDKKLEIKDQHTKLQQLSQQQTSKAEDVQTEDYAGQQFQPMPPFETSKQPVGREGQSFETRRTLQRWGSNSYGGPSPLIRLTHTSNWADDERETLQSVHPQASMQSDRMESARSRNGYHLSDSWVLDLKQTIDLGRPMLRNGSLSGYGIDFRDSRDHNKRAGIGLEGESIRDTGSSNDAVKGSFNKQLDVDSWEDIESSSRGPGRNDSLKRDWSFSAKEINNDRDARLGNSGRSFNTRSTGLERERNTNVRRDADLSFSGDNGSIMSTREVRSQDGRSRPNASFNKSGVNDWLGERSRKSTGNYQRGSANVGRLQNDLSGLDYGREKRVSALYRQDPFSEEPLSSKASSSLVLEAFIGMSGLEAKTYRRKKDESLNFHDPARELFEAELERVQKMQEQERQRLAEERERAIELARKEEEERERLAKEEELLRLKIEEEAREAAAQAQREAEEAARKAEEIRRAREEEKRMVMLEEERRKEAAKRKLLDLEQRIAQREALQQQQSYSGTDASTGALERSRRLDAEEHRALPSFSKLDSNEEHVLGIDKSRSIPLESTVRLSVDIRGGEGTSGDRNRVVQMKRRETLDDGPGLLLISKKYHLRDNPTWSEHEREYRGFSMREPSVGPNRSVLLGVSRSSSLVHGQERVHTDSFARNKQWQSGNSSGFSGGHLSADINSGYMDPATERDNDGWWARDDRRRFQEGQRLNSPPLPFHMNDGDNDYPLFGRLRQSLPKQPRVPPPIFGRSTSHKQVIQSEVMPAVSSPYPTDDSEGRCKDGSNADGEQAISENNSKKADYVEKLPIESPIEGKSELAAPTDDFVPSHHTTKVSDEIDKAELTIASQKCEDEILEPDEIDELSEQLSDLTESEERLAEDEKQLVVDVELARSVESADDEDGWLVQEKTENMDEEMCTDDFQDKLAVEDASDDQEWDSSKVLEVVTTNVEHGTEKEEVDEATWESQHVEDEGDGVVDDPEGAADTHWESNELFAPKIKKQDDTEPKDIGIQDGVKDHVVQLQNVLSSASTFNFAQAGQSEGHSHGQSFLQHFQQPFSFMAVPLSQSTALNGAASHPPMLPSMHTVQAHQELPYHLQMGLLPGTPLMPNAIQIGSIQMPLQVHPQMAPVAHIHHQQPPIFQFGQLCPFSQPLPPIQPAVQTHHSMGQPLSAQHHQAEFLFPVEGSRLSKVDEVVKKAEEMAVQGSYDLSSLENPVDSILGGGISSEEHIDHNKSTGSITTSLTHLPSVETVHDAAALQGVDVSVKANQDSLVGKIIGGRRRNNNSRSSGIYGRGRGRPHFVKNHDHKGPYSVSESWPENTVNEEVRNRIYRQTFRRAEYKIRKSLQTSERDSESTVDQENHLPSYAKDGNTSDGLKSTEIYSTEDTSELRSYLFSSSIEGSNGQHTETLSSLQSSQVGFGRVETDVGLTEIIRSTNTIGNSRKGNIYNSDLGDAPLQSGITFVYEDQGSEVQNEKDDDFIEVRSKRQLLREQRELRDKAKSRELKVKDQVARKQQKVVGKSVLHEEAVISQGRVVKQLPAAIGSGLQQFCATPTSLGLPAAAPSEPKVSKSGQYQPVVVTTVADSGKGQTFDHRYSNDALDSTTTASAAWGMQRSPHEVVSLTQIQLEETMKPFSFDGISAQLAPIAERGPKVLEQGIPLTSSSLDKVAAPVKASVSMPGPISSLLAGEKIQFGAVTSPTVISSPSHPPSPSFVGAIGSQFGADMANFSSHPLSHARNYFGADMSGAFLSRKMITGSEDDVNRQLADSEAEAEAAASAIAVAAISNDEAVGNHSDASLALGGGAAVGTFASFSKSSGLDSTAAGIIQAPSKSLGVNDSMSLGLPADLSLETPAPLLQASLPSHPVSSDIMMQSFPSRASPFPCLEMGTILGGPIFAYGPRDDASMSSFEPGFAGMGAGNVAGWQHRHSNASDSFYGAPPPFMSPAGLPSIQGHPHMLVYTNPFTPVGQFGQLGVSFMGTAYHPSGKQPDWTHTPYTTSSGALNQSVGDMNPGLPVMMDSQHSGVASNAAQAISMAGCSMMPVPPPMNLFDPNFSSPFQAQWSRAPSPPFSSYHVPGPAPGFNLQSRASVVPGELGHLSQSIHMSDNSHQLPETSGLHMPGDAAAGVPGVNIPDELGYAYSVLASNSGLNNVEMVTNRGLCTGVAELVGSNLQQSQGMPQSSHANLNLASASGRNELYLGTQDARGGPIEASHAQISDLEQQVALGHLPTTSTLMDKRAPQQAQARGSSVVDLQRRGSLRSVSTISGGERGPASSSKSKQIYVAKPAAPIGAT